MFKELNLAICHYQFFRFSENVDEGRSVPGLPIFNVKGAARLSLLVVETILCIGLGGRRLDGLSAN